MLRHDMTCQANFQWTDSLQYYFIYLFILIYSHLAPLWVGSWYENIHDMTLHAMQGHDIS